MDSYGVFQLGSYMVSLPGAFIYLFSILLMLRIAFSIVDRGDTPSFQVGRFTLYSILFAGLMTFLWLYLGLWFCVQA